MKALSKKQRLAIFLDGTWNTEDDSTNILHAYSLTIEGLLAEEDGQIFQKRYYDRGVGTGVMDNIGGGAFGLGLETNVREAYNWLVDNYDDGDEIYIFGFSRGAFTARSLVGFIAACEIVKRGAPLMTSQLWKGYTQIGRARANRSSWWENIFGKKEPPFNRITELKVDEWVYATEPKLIPPEKRNKTEKLLHQFSRRVKITYVGIFDTVGAIGIDALGIPGLLNKMALQHNQNPTKLLGSCHHALAIDENRSSFRLTPFLDYVENTEVEIEKAQQYNKIIHQNWFVGAHSNVGGGYADNLLSVAPLKWIMKGATQAGLKLKIDIDNYKFAEFKPKEEDIRDSYAEFGMLWTDLLRAKRYYRPIGRLDDVRAVYSLRSINEKIDDSVIDFAQTNLDYAPPNLLSFINKYGSKAQKAVFKDRPSEFVWAGNTFPKRITLIIWSLIVALGIEGIVKVFFPETSFPHWTIYGLLALIYLLIDWGESVSVLKNALNPDSVKWRVVRNVLQWLGLFGILSFFIGIGVVISKIWAVARISPFIYSMDTKIIHQCIYIATSSGVLMLFLDLAYSKVPKESNHGKNVEKSLSAILLSPIIIGLLVILIFSILSLIPYFFGVFTIKVTPVLPADEAAGKILLMQILFVIFYFTFTWVGKPMGKSRANLDSIVYLQGAFTPKRVENLFKKWNDTLMCKWVEEQNQQPRAWARLKSIIQEALWRDIIGFIPIFTAVFGLIIWIGITYDFGNTTKGLSYLAKPIILGIPFWIVMIGATFFADIMEDAIHLKHIKNWDKGKSSVGLIMLGMIATAIKFLGFFASLIYSVGIFIWVSTHFFQEYNAGGWRWILANCSMIMVGILFLGIAIGKMRQQFEEAEEA